MTCKKWTMQKNSSSIKPRFLVKFVNFLWGKWITYRSSISTSRLQKFFCGSDFTLKSLKERPAICTLWQFWWCSPEKNVTFQRQPDPQTNKPPKTTIPLSNSVSGWCSTPTLLLICSSFSTENGHPLLICSSLSTTQVFFRMMKPILAFFSHNPYK